MYSTLVSRGVFHTRIPSLPPLTYVDPQPCLVTFKSKESLVAAYPMNVNGDVLGDLPEISNFCMADGQVYK